MKFKVKTLNLMLTHYEKGEQKELNYYINFDNVVRFNEKVQAYNNK